MDRDNSELKDKYGSRLDDEPSNHGPDLGNYPDMGIESSVKKEWTALSFYLPDGMVNRINDTFRDLRYESGDRLQKGRHFYPLLVELGMERAEDMDVDEIKERLERMEE